MNIEPQSNEDNINVLIEAVADRRKRTYVWSERRTVRVTEATEWAIEEIKRLNELLAGLYASAQARHDNEAKLGDFVWLARCLAGSSARHIKSLREQANGLLKSHDASDSDLSNK